MSESKVKQPNDHQQEMRRLFSLAQDGVLDEAQRNQLQSLLTENPPLRKEYVRLAITESQLEQLHTRPLLNESDTAKSDVVPAAHFPSSIDQPKKKKESPTRSQSAPTRGDVVKASLPPMQRRSFGWLYACAAMVLIAAVVGSFFALQGNEFATVVAVEMGGEEQCDYTVGDTLSSQWVQIDSSVVHLSFKSSAMVAIHGPAKFRATGQNEAELQWGSVSVHVPEAASGFTVLSDTIDVEDLGTGFSFRLLPTGEANVHVTEGKVRVRDKQTNANVVATAGQVVVGDAKHSGDKKIRVLKSPATAPKVSGQFVYAKEHPRSLGYDAFDHDHRAFVFLECTQRTLPYDLSVNIASPGKFESFSQVAGTIPQGTVVDCYLIHCAPKSEFHETRGSVTFPGEILGIICDHDRLNATNEVLGASWTLRCNYVHRGLEKIPFDSADAILLNPNRRTITALMRNRAIDQFRVLVKAN